ncbi:ArsR family transcriptional regulator [bacterium (Candidatus Blackallbacteria) CG17_big_fil_post_rev_8_21_14_2_50_48_46]|uniref:ArsR family transcriptional regulator n=1 Tax=bacterium (Candidatus Blackallbacteria) CG17_big_fil_post_rev_8_21_14_2_50_48_46 TaxID=2014261 RepID=A0A2M7G4K7_9BACT|nr:MAG: transcriptional regulator [bacterium (Candidatus Blackallbacteria) CG18_big_fil_WC_8_21_14_2_50_49_26]PIW16766.1 MAG: ArsR family transcriptional regulator [bacterium (Candidatus Blackallbacteria) CG17_big_fil_post_rev_8_21_14_2_50_48_46]PIW49558.1 MAG: ArsR family transcriptional regulator [bacterium (Candidatus Blackallbacteria) CG13_big_fil_rev_8_21_14_2_50_49_14]
MPARLLVTKELSKFLGVLSHAHRIRIVEELRHGERDVNFLEGALGISHARVSQHLALMRSHRLVLERRDGRRVFYRLSQPELAVWLLEGLRFIEQDITAVQDIRQAVQEVKSLWSEDQTLAETELSTVHKEPK